LKAQRLLQSGDVILYDHLVAKPILEYARRDAEKIYVGKQAGKHHCSQETIHQKMLSFAQQGLHVIRLKGGDPLLFARGGEEFVFLREHGIPLQVVPGITAALGCAAAMKIPLTHRDMAEGCIFVTAHHCRSQVPAWHSLVHSDKTLVFYMGLKSINTICQQLIAHGMRLDMPIALIASGTMEEEKIAIGTLATLPGQVAEEVFASPVLIIIGDVVSLYKAD